MTYVCLHYYLFFLGMNVAKVWLYDGWWMTMCVCTGTLVKCAGIVFIAFIPFFTKNTHWLVQWSLKSYSISITLYVSSCFTLSKSYFIHLPFTQTVQLTFISSQFTVEHSELWWPIKSYVNLKRLLLHWLGKEMHFMKSWQHIFSMKGCIYCFQDEHNLELFEC